MIVVYSFIYEHVFVHIFIVNFHSKYSSSIDRTLFCINIFLVLRLVLGVLLSYIFSYSLDCLANWTCRPYKMYCMHAFLCPLFLGECIGRFIPSLCTYHYCLRFYGNFPFPRLRMAHDDTSPCPKILNVFN